MAKRNRMRLKMPLLGSLVESFMAEFRQKIKPVPGCVLKCDLLGGADFLGGTVCHTGVYLGGDRIVEIVNSRGRAKVHIVDPGDFLNGQGTCFVRTGINIYVATDGEGRALGSAQIAERALEYRKTHRSRGGYNLVDNNCHKFTVRCVTGEEPKDAQLTEADVEVALKAVFGCGAVTWEPTGFGPGDTSFDDVDLK